MPTLGLIFMAQRDKVMVFIDGSNLYHVVKNLLPELKPFEFNFESFVKQLVGDRELVAVNYYNAPLDRQKDDSGYIKQQRFFEKIKRIPLFHLILCRMQKRIVDGKIIYEVKEDDIHLAVDMVKMAYNGAYDTAILVSSDGDFVPAVLAVKDIGKKVENVGFENKFSYHLQQKSSRFIKLRKENVSQFFGD